MSLKYIGKALMAISDADRERCDWAAYYLGKKKPNEVSMLDKELASGFSKSSMIADYQRGLRLLQKLKGDYYPLYKPEENEHSLKASIRTFKINDKPLPTQGFILKCSFWIFANQNEREQIIDAWYEADRVLAFGLITALKAKAGVKGAQELIRKWFSDENITDAAQKASVARMKRERNPGLSERPRNPAFRYRSMRATLANESYTRICQCKI